jgi:IS30 family transposase
MEVLMSDKERKGKHLSFDERDKIRGGLKDRMTFTEIGLMIGRDPTTISKEVRKHRFSIPFKGRDNVRENLCALKKSCKRRNVCNKKPKYKCKIPCRNCIGYNKLCPDFVEETCFIMKRPPYVCNGCDKQSKCILDKYYYGPSPAYKEYKQTLTEARTGINLDRDELAQLDNLVTPLLKKGQPIAHIYANHRDEIKISQRTLYKYIDSGYMGVINLDLRRTVRYRKRRKVKEVKLDSRLKLGRHYEDFQVYMEKDTESEVVEMDTVEGKKGGKLFLTMFFRKSNLMLIFLIEDKRKDTILKRFEWLEGELGSELFKKTFPLILTDNAVEFADPVALETGLDGIERTKDFYCDPGKSGQKGSLEKNHEYIRYVLPKGISFDELSQENVNNLMNHINSTARPSLNDKTPMALAELLLDDKVKEKLGLKLIPPDEVILRPELLKK